MTRTLRHSKKRNIAAHSLPITQAELRAAFLFSSLFTLIVMLDKCPAEALEIKENDIYARQLEELDRKANR